MADKSFEREASKRLFAEEFRATKFSRKFSDEEKAPTFVITPTGAVANRMLISGVMTRKEKKDQKGGGGVFYRAAINDNTGNFFVSATSYQPDALSEMAKIQAPSFVTIIGKPNLYETPDKTMLASVRVEDIIVVDKETREEWIIDTAESTLKRIALMEAGTDKAYNEAKQMYGTDTKVFRLTVKKALESILSQSA